MLEITAFHGLYTFLVSALNPLVFLLLRCQSVTFFTLSILFIPIQLLVLLHACLFVFGRDPPPSPVGQGLLIHEFSRSHSDTPQSVGLLWMSDQLVAETST
jgi:hypothetical protein